MQRKNNKKRLSQIFTEKRWGESNCINFDKPIELFGFWGKENISAFGFEITICQNTTDNTCASMQEIKNMFKPPLWFVCAMGAIVGGFAMLYPIAFFSEKGYQWFDPELMPPKRQSKGFCVEPA